MRVGAVDCGTNSIRLLIADIDGSSAADVERQMRVVRLGQGVDQTGVLAADALARTREALVDYSRLCTDLAVEKVRMVATSATRDAANSDEFVAMVHEVLGVEPDVVSGDEEAALSFAGATRGLTAPTPYLVVDIGGGSTELVVGTTTVDAACSMDVGCVRLTERHLHDDPPSSAQVSSARADLEAALNTALAVVPTADIGTAIGLAGSVTTVAAIALGLTSYDPERIHHSTVTRAEVRQVTDRLLAMTRAQRAALPVMHPGRVDVIGAGALVLDTVMARTGIEELLVSEADILDGIAWSVR
ncbi:MAG: exopolyphosphatase [Frankiales bacterium]|nr:exopolyphosphatase [Frankiales bacterium]